MKRYAPRTYRLVGKVPVEEPDFIAVFGERMEIGARTGKDPWRVALTEVPGGSVSTVFLGLDHNHWGNGDPLLFETAIFRKGETDIVGRCSTWEQAEAQHEEAVRSYTYLRVVK